MTEKLFINKPENTDESELASLRLQLDSIRNWTHESPDVLALQIKELEDKIKKIEGKHTS